MDKQYPMAVFPSAQPEVSTERNGESFVDDTTLWVTSMIASFQEVIQQMTSKAQAWERRVHIAGGALNLLKTFFYAISWKYQKNGQPVTCAVSDDPDTDILLTQGNNRSRPTKITQVEVTTGKRTLGVRLAPRNGSDKTEYEYRLAEATKLRPRLLRAPLNRKSMRKGFTTMILQKFSYPLGATCFTEKECNSIQAKFLPTVLSKMGINRSTPREVRSSPSL
jgi:hypothetical protein